jgi:hypothetical protein
MNNTIERRFAAVCDRRCMSKARKLRKDSILGGLPPAQRAMVDKGLFDKGMTYQEVAEACGRMFGVTVGRSSVGRYFQAKSKVQMEKSKVQSLMSKVGEGESVVDAGDAISFRAPAPSPQPSPPVGARELTPEETYERLLAKVRQMAWVEANLPAVLRDVKYFCQLMRILIAARRERNQAVLAAVERKKFERRAAKEVLENLRYTIDDLRGSRNQSRSATAIQDGGEEHRLPFQRVWENPIISVVPPGQKHASATHQGLRPWLISAAPPERRPQSPARRPGRAVPTLNLKVET